MKAGLVRDSIQNKESIRLITQSCFSLISSILSAMLKITSSIYVGKLVLKVSIEVDSKSIIRLHQTTKPNHQLTVHPSPSYHHQHISSLFTVKAHNNISTMNITKTTTLQRSPKKEHSAARVKTSPSLEKSPLPQCKLAEDAIIPFPSSRYTFPNKTSNAISGCKTSITLRITAQVLEKIVRVNHPNMIGIKKILKSWSKEQSECGGTHYSFFYEPVHFSVQYLAEHPSQHPRLHSLLMTTDLPAVISSLAQYLQKAAISYMIRPEDVGISLEGNIKVYVPPNVILCPGITSGLQNTSAKFADWWQGQLQQLASWGFKKEKKGLQLQPPKLSLNEDFSLDEQSGRESMLEKELEDLLEEGVLDQSAPQEKNLGSHLKESVSSLSKVGSLQIEKINKINEEIKVIRERMNEQKKTHPEPAKKDFFRTKTTGRTDQPRKICNKQEEKKAEAIQQNINCINIYNHNNVPLNNYSNRYNSLGNFLQPLPNNYQAYPDAELYGYYDDNYSQDTYDIEFEGQFEGCSGGNNRDSTPFRHTIFTEDRDLSEYKGGKKPRDQKYKELKAKQHVNQVCNKNYTQSAGPLQFKRIVGKFIQAQEKMEEEEEKNGSSRKGLSSRKDGRSASVEKGIKQKQFKPSKVESSCEIKTSDIKRNYSQNVFCNSTRLNSTCEAHNALEEKVKLALQKTKNAIALLNKVKQQKNGTMSQNL